MLGNDDNEVTFIGNLGHDVDSWRTTRSGLEVANFRVASSRKFMRPDGTEDEKTTWMTVHAWGPLAVALVNSGQARKGARVVVIGELEPDTYRSRDGVEIDTVAIRAREVAVAASSLTAGA